jgi:hypothetical protein
VPGVDDAKRDDGRLPCVCPLKSGASQKLFLRGARFRLHSSTQHGNLALNQRYEDSFPFTVSPYNCDMPNPLQQLIHILSHTDTDSPIHRFTASPSPDWPAVLARAKTHRVIPLLYRNTKGIIPSPQKEELEKSFFANIARTEVLVKELGSLYSLLTEKGIPVLPYKGPALAQLAYGDPAMRRYDDLDLIVQTADILRARKILQGQGYEQAPGLTARQTQRLLQAGGEWLFWNPQMRLHIDLKPMMVSRLMSNEKETKRLFRNAEEVQIGGERVMSLSPEDTFLCACLHGTLTRWSPLKQIADAAALMQRPDIDWQDLLSTCQGNGTKTMLLHALSLANSVFGTPIPESFRDSIQEDRTAQRLTSEIVRDIETGQLACRRTKRWHYKLRAWQGFKHKARFIYRQFINR